MNQSQIKYAKQRATVIFDKKKREILVEFAVKPLTTEQKIEAIQAGRFIINKNRLNDYNWANCIEFIDQRVEDTEAKEAKIKLLNNTFRNITDELVLGDVQEVLAILRKFEEE